MAFPRVTAPVNNITNQPVRPVISAPSLQALFDKIGKDLKDYTNDELLPALESTTDGNSGLDNIGMTPIAGLNATTPQEALEELKALSPINIADGSIGDIKLSNVAGQIKSVVQDHTINLNDIGYFESKFGIVGDGITDDYTAMQQYADFCLLNKRKFQLSGKKYFISNPIKISNTNVPNWPIFEVEGELSGTAVSVFQSESPGTTIITDGNNAFELEFYSFFNESVKFKNISFYNKGIKGTSKAIHYKFNQTSYARKQEFIDVNCCNFYVGVEFQGLSVVFEDNYFGTTVFDLFNAYECSTPIHLNNSYANLIEIKNSLLFQADDCGIKCGDDDGGGIISISNSHFEGCEPSALKFGARSTTVSMHNVSAESCGVVSGSGFVDSINNTNNLTIFINGFFNKNLMPAMKLGTNTILSSYAEKVEINSAGAIVLTPENVILNSDMYGFAFYPTEKLTTPERGIQLFGFGGDTTGLNPTTTTDIPESFLSDYVFCDRDSIYDQRSTFGTNIENRILVSSFIFKTTGLVGFNTGSQFIIDGNTTLINNAFVNSYNGSLVCVLVIPVNSNKNLTRLSLLFRDLVYSTPAHVTLEPTARNMTLLSLGHPKTRMQTEVIYLPSTGVQIFKETGIYNKPYAISSTLLINDGEKGCINYNFYGVSENGKKFVDVIGTSKDVNVVLSTSDGANQDLYNLSVSNFTAGTIKLTFVKNYKS